MARATSMEQRNTPEREYHQSLDGLRALAILIVLFGHALAAYFPQRGGVGVDVFFVLSGFLITSILSSEANLYGRISFRNFYIRRFLRLLPCLFLTIILFSIYSQAVAGYVPIKDIIVGLTYTSNWGMALFNYELGPLSHLWSLATEEQYYAVWPIAVLFLHRLFKNHFSRGLALIVFAASIGIYRYLMVGSYSLERIYFGLDTHMDGLAMGSAFCYLIKTMKTKGSISSPNSKLLGLLLAPLCACVLFTISAMPGSTPFMARFGYSTIAIASSIILTDLVLGSHSALKKILCVKPMVFIGKISYGLYLLHPIVYHTLDNIYHSQSVLMIVTIKMFFSVAIASASFFFIEKHFLRLKKYFEPTPERQAPQPEPAVLTTSW